MEERIKGGAVKEDRSPLKEAIDFRRIHRLVREMSCQLRGVATYLEET